MANKHSIRDAKGRFSQKPRTPFDKMIQSWPTPAGGHKFPFGNPAMERQVIPAGQTPGRSYHMSEWKNGPTSEEIDEILKKQKEAAAKMSYGQVVYNSKEGQKIVNPAKPPEKRIDWAGVILAFVAGAVSSLWIFVWLRYTGRI